MNQAVFSLIGRHQRFGALLQEASYEVCSSEKPAEVVLPCLDMNTSVDGCVSYIKSQAHLLGSPIPTVAAITCARELTRLLLQTLPEIGLHQNILCIMKLIGVLISQQLLNKTVFIHELTLKVEALPLELLWQLHSCSAIYFDQYIQHNVRSVSVLRRLSQDISNLCMKLDDLDEDTRTLKRGVLAVLVRCAYSKSEEQFEVDQRLVNVSQDILDSIVVELLTLQNQSHASVQDYHVARMFEMVQGDLGLDKDIISRFSAKQLILLLHWNPDCHVSTAVTRQHDKWTYIKAPENITKMFTQLLLTINEKQVCSVLRNVLHGEKINWSHTLVLVSVFCVCFRRGSSHIKDLVTELLTESLNDCISVLLHAAFLLARQAAAEETCDFPSYPRWFQDQFSTSASLHVSSSKSFSFFMEFLTSLVPHEPVHCLKAHIQYQPHMPYKCREVLMDYIALAKTRLADFKENWQINGATRSSDGQKMQAANQQAVEDMKLAVTTFEKTGRIHEKILQASIFRRPYYMGQFLPALLVPRMLPEIPDCRMLFIEALKRSEKIPRHMYEKYTEDCAHELRTLLEGVSSEDMDEISLEPMQRLQDILDSLTDVLLKDPDNSAYNAGIAGHMALIAGRVTTVLEDLGATSSNVSNIDGGITLDICENTTIEPAIMQVTDMLLSCFCKVHLLMIDAKLSCSTIHVVNENFSLMLANQGHLSYPTYYRLFTLLCHQGDTLSDEHITSLASLLVHMSALGERLPHVKLRTPAKHPKEDVEPDYMCLLNLISANLPHCTGNDMRFAHKFCTAVMTKVATFTESIQHKISNKQLIQKFCYLRLRLDPASRLKCISVSGQPSSDQSGTCSMNKQGEYDQELCKGLGMKLQLSHQDLLSLEMWIQLELRIHKCQDCLTPTQRKQYHHWILYSHFLPQLVQTTYRDNPALAYKRASTMILHALLDRYAEPSVMRYELCPHRVSKDQACQGDNECIQCLSLCQEVIQLLQELLRLWCTAPSLQPTVTMTEHETCSIKAECPWLLAQYEDRLQRISPLRSADGNLSPVLQLSLELSNQMLLYQYLPPYLLLTNDLSHNPSPVGLSHLISYINVYLREHLQDDFWYSYGTVASILQGILELYSHAVQSNSEEVKDIVASIEQLLQECPLFTLSVLRHWDMLVPLMSHRRSQDVVLFTLLHQLHGLVHGIYNTEPSTGLSSVDVIDKVVSKQWLLVIVVVGAFILHTRKTSSVDELVDLNGILFYQLKPYFSEETISGCLFEYHIAQAAWSILIQSSDNTTLDVHCQAAQNLLNKHPNSIKTCTGSSILQGIVQQSISSLYPVICFRILQSSNCHRVLQYAGRDPHILTPILVLYSSLMHLHCHIDAPITYLSDYHTPGQQQQIISLEFLHSCRALLCGLIGDCSCQTLAAVDQTLSADSDPELKSLIAQRLLQQ